MTKIVSYDYQQFWVYFEWFLAFFHISGEKWLLSDQNGPLTGFYKGGL